MPTTRRFRCSAPGAGKTKTGRQWVYLRDERPHAGTAPPAVLYRYTPDRKGEHCRAELARFIGWLHADGYAGFGRLYEIAGMRSSDTGLLQGPPRVAEVACWAHVRRGFFDEYASHQSAIAKEALDRIGALFDIERLIAGTAARDQANRAPANGAAEDRRAGDMARRTAADAARQERSRRRHPLCPLALACAHPLPRRRSPGDSEQRRGKPNQAGWLSGEKTGCSQAATPEVSARLRSTR